MVIRSYPFNNHIVIAPNNLVHTLHSFINSFAMEYANKRTAQFHIARAAGSLGAAFASFGVGYITASQGGFGPHNMFAMFLLLIPVTLSFKPA